MTDPPVLDFFRPKLVRLLEVQGQMMLWIDGILIKGVRGWEIGRDFETVRIWNGPVGHVALGRMRLTVQLGYGGEIVIEPEWFEDGRPKC